MILLNKIYEICLWREVNSFLSTVSASHDSNKPTIGASGWEFLKSKLAQLPLGVSLPFWNWEKKRCENKIVTIFYLVNSLTFFESFFLLLILAVVELLINARASFTLFWKAFAFWMLSTSVKDSRLEFVGVVTYFNAN